MHSPRHSREPDKDYSDRVKSLLPNGWRISRGFFWTQVLAPKKNYPNQGWKIHISCHHDSDIWTLETALKICLAHNTEFKFASDPATLSQLLSKNCTRSASGKFITIYPAPSQFDELIEALYIAFKDCKGPYILSDKPYKDSEVIFYRYGGFKRIEHMNVFGERSSQILNEDFFEIEDIRSPKYVTPTFIIDKNYELTSKQAESSSTDESSSELFDKFEFISCIKHSNAGGVYVGKEKATDNTVLIKEARPFVGMNSGDFSVIKLLEKELRLMEELAQDDIAPTPYGMYPAWTHHFMVQEFLTGSTLKNFSVNISQFIHANCTTFELNNWLAKFQTLSLNTIEMVEKLHHKKIIFGDLSFNNIMVDSDTLETKLIDFEGAFQKQVDPEVNLYTPGFYTEDRPDKSQPDFCDDIYALGCVLLSVLMPTTYMLSYDTNFAKTLTGHLERDFSLPSEISEAIDLLLKNAPDALYKSKTLLESIELGSMAKCQYQGFDFAKLTEYPKCIFELCEAHLATQRMEYVLPLDNKREFALAMNHGELGVAYAWKITQGEIPTALSEWLKNQNYYELPDLPPGLMNGCAGAAWGFSELGLVQEARRAFNVSRLHRKLYDSCSLGYGLAGTGLCALKLYLKFDDDYYLDLAKGYADYILEEGIKDQNGYYYWPQVDTEKTPIGLIEGGAGIALFLLKLFAVTKESRYLEVGKSALKYDLSFKQEKYGSIGFPADSGGGIFYPYVQCGSAGIAMVLLRYYKMTQKQYFLDEINQLRASLSTKYSVSSGYFSGLAGIGSFLLDAHQILNDESYFEDACRVADGINIYSVHYAEGLGYPGAMRQKLSCDLGAGSAGVALFYDRLLNKKSNQLFMLDELLN
nr:class III lanthionine synthetase LanKC [Pseudoalteromonas phenolica]